MPNQCNRCRFWREADEHRDPADENWGWGQCRRGAPQIVSAMLAPQMPQLRYGQQADIDVDAIDVATASLFPVTHSSEWCGQFDAIHSGVPV